MGLSPKPAALQPPWPRDWRVLGRASERIWHRSSWALDPSSASSPVAAASSSSSATRRLAQDDRSVRQASPSIRFGGSCPDLNPGGPWCGVCQNTQIQTRCECGRRNERSSRAPKLARSRTVGGWGPIPTTRAEGGVRGLSGPFHARVRTEQQQIQPQQSPGQAQQHDRSIDQRTGWPRRPPRPCLLLLPRKPTPKPTTQRSKRKQTNSQLTPLCRFVSMFSLSVSYSIGRSFVSSCIHEVLWVLRLSRSVAGLKMTDGQGPGTPLPSKGSGAGPRRSVGHIHSCANGAPSINLPPTTTRPFIYLSHPAFGMCVAPLSLNRPPVVQRYITLQRRGDKTHINDNFCPPATPKTRPADGGKAAGLRLKQN